MQWLGVGRWQDYLELPSDIVQEAVYLMHYEHDERERLARHYESHRGKKGKAPKYIPLPYVSPLSVPNLPKKEEPSQKVIIDEHGHERVERMKKDGTVVRHRKIEPADLIMWSISGKIPKSFKGKVDMGELLRKPKEKSEAKDGN